MNVGNLGPLDWRMGIVDSKGRPTPEFQRRWEQQRTNNGAIGTVLTGSGAPVTPPTQDGQMYIDTSSVPPAVYIGSGGAWLSVGVVDFINLADVPHSYSGNTLRLAQVNAGETGLQFTSMSGALDQLGSAARGDILYRSATGWAFLAPGTAGYVLTAHGTGADPTWAASTGGVTSFNTRTGAVTLTSADVTTALTYTPLAPSAIGTTVQAYSANLTSYATVAPSSNVLTFLGAANYAAMRTQLGLGTAALLASDTDGTLAANSDSNIATQKAVKTYVDNHTVTLYVPLALGTEPLQFVSFGNGVPVMVGFTP